MIDMSPIVVDVVVGLACHQKLSSYRMVTYVEVKNERSSAPTRGMSAYSLRALHEWRLDAEYLVVPKFARATV